MMREAALKRLAIVLITNRATRNHGERVVTERYDIIESENPQAPAITFRVSKRGSGKQNVTGSCRAAPFAVMWRVHLYTYP
jgi:hypothetical protein